MRTTSIRTTTAVGLFQATSTIPPKTTMPHCTAVAVVGQPGRPRVGGDASRRVSHARAGGLERDAQRAAGQQRQPGQHEAEQDREPQRVAQHDDERVEDVRGGLPRQHRLVDRVQVERPADPDERQQQERREREPERRA